jgi:acyl-CoA thioester hydrolase
MPNPYSDPPDGRFVHEWFVPVRYSETDQMGVVHHSVPALWMEEGRTRMMADAGYPYTETERDGIFLPVVELQIRFLKPALYGGRVRVQSWIQHTSQTKVQFRNRILDESGAILVEGIVTLGCVDKSTRRPARFNARLERFVASDGRTS